MGAGVYKLRWWVLLAGLIWVFIKLPQEWWIHVAQLDFTDFLAEHSWAAPLLLVVFAIAAVVFLVRGPPRLRTPDHDWQFDADPLPEPMDTATRCRPGGPRTAGSGRSQTVEKVVLLGLLSVIFAQTLPGVPGVDLRPLRRHRRRRRRQQPRSHWPWPGAAAASSPSALQFGLRILLNLGIVVARRLAARLDGGDLDRADTFFYLC